MHFFQLPPEIRGCIFEQLISDLTFKGAVKLRHVNKAFGREILQMLFLKGRITVSRPDWRDSVHYYLPVPNPIAAGYLDWKLEHCGSQACELIDSIRFAASYLATLGHDEGSVLAQLCAATMATWEEEHIIQLLSSPAQKGYTPLPKAERDSNLLGAAAVIGDLQLVIVLSSDKGVASAKLNGRSFFGDPLTAAARAGHTSVVAYLLKETNVRQSEQDKPLFKLLRYPSLTFEVAAMNGHQDVVDLIYSHDPNARLHKARLDGMEAASEKGNLDMIKWIARQAPAIELSGKANPPDRRRDYTRRRLLYNAIAGGYYELAEIILDYGVDLFDNAMPDFTTYLELAACCGYDNILRLLFEHGKGYPHSKTAVWREPVSQAVRCGWVGTTEILIDHGFSIYLEVPAPIVTATKDRDLPMVQLLLRKGFNSEQSMHIEPGYHNFMCAFVDHIDQPDLNIMDLLIEHGLSFRGTGPHSDEELAEGNTAMQKAILAGKREWIQYLEDKGVRPIDYKDGVWSWRDGKDLHVVYEDGLASWKDKQMPDEASIYRSEDCFAVNVDGR